MEIIHQETDVIQVAKSSKGTHVSTAPCLQFALLPVETASCTPANHVTTETQLQETDVRVLVLLSKAILVQELIMKTA